MIGLATLMKLWMVVDAISKHFPNISKRGETLNDQECAVETGRLSGGSISCSTVPLSEVLSR